MTNDEMFNLLVEKMSEMENRLDSKMNKMEKRLDDKMDKIEKRLDDKIDKLEKRLDDKIDKLEKRMDNVQITLENEITPNIQAIAEGHLDLARKLDEANKISNEKEIMKIRLNALESEVEKLKTKLAQ